MTPETFLIDRRNIDEHLNRIGDELSRSTLTGVDCETEDSERHDGLNQFSGYSDKGTRSKTKRLVIDMRRSKLCGVSFFSNETRGAYYLNTGHVDADNRLPLSVVRDLLQTAKGLVAHNAPFEKVIFQNTLGLDVPLTCTLQMAVSCFGPHEYPHNKWIEVGQGGIGKLIPLIAREVGNGGIIDRDKGELSPELSDLIGKITAKESTADHSYNGLVSSISYGYGLKKLIKSVFNYEMTTYEQVLNGHAHMGLLTGEETARYGAEDAFWVVPLFQYLFSRMMETGGEKLVNCFLKQENPMVDTFAGIARSGMKVNGPAIVERRDFERAEMAGILRDLKAVVGSLLPFSPQLHEGLEKYDGKTWYSKNWQKYRGQIEAWANSADSTDDFEQCQQVRGPVSNAWASDAKCPESLGPNFAHYMPVRTLIYDLVRTKCIVSQGKVQSDGEARGFLHTRVERFLKNDRLEPQERQRLENCLRLFECLARVAGVEQRMKLYLTPYSQLTDPETDKLYPSVSSMLATRRMAASNPNPMQLAKRGESTYVRGFFEPSYDDHVLISIDWSAIELVEIAEFSGDPEMCKAFSQIPHDDLHSGAAADILTVEVPELTEEAFKALKKAAKWDEYADRYGISTNLSRLKTNFKGDALKNPADAYKFWRTEVGKGANFNYWYSGWLATIGGRMGWSPDKTQLATDRYKSRFSVAESWRVGIIDEVQQNGFVTLPDGHRYVRYEATQQWAEEWRSKFQQDGDLGWVMRRIGHQIARRGGNQSVNAYIQGSCATIAKRSERRVDAMIKDRGWGHREAHFLIPIHDELVWSVHKSLVGEFVPAARGIMITHPDLFSKCLLDASPSIGRTFEPWSASKAPRGQIELFEMPPEIVGQDRAFQRATTDEIQQITDYLFHQEMRKAA